MLLTCPVGVEHIVDHPEPTVRLRELAQSGLKFELLVWIGEVMDGEAAEREVERVVGERQPGDVGPRQRHPVDGAVAKSAAGHVEHLGRQVGADDPTDVRRDRLALMCGAARDLEDEHRRVEWLQMPRDPSREAGIGEERVLTFEGR